MMNLGMIPVLTQKLCAPLSLALNTILLQLDFFSHGSVFLVVARSDRYHLPIWIIYILNTLFCGTFGMSMSMFALHFVYRYLVVTGNSYIKKMTWKKFITWLLSPLLYAALWITVVVITLKPNESTDAILTEYFLPGRDIIIEEITYIGPNYFITDQEGKETLNWCAVLGMLFLDLMVILSVIITILFATKCYKKVSSLANSFQHSKSYRDLQSQLLNCLVAQVIIPATLIQIPAFILVTFPFFHLGNELSGSLFCTTVALYPVLDPLPTMLMIQHYREALINTVTINKKATAAQKALNASRTMTANVPNVGS